MIVEFSVVILIYIKFIFYRGHSERMDPPRIELGASRCKRDVLPLDYGPNIMGSLSWFLILAD